MRFLLLLFLLICVGCEAATDDEAATLTPTPMPTLTATFTALPTETATALPSDTPTATATLPPTATLTPSDTPPPTATPTATIPPTNTPIPVATGFATPGTSFDRLELLIDLPDQLGAFNSQRVVFINENDSVNISNLSTASPDTGAQILYFADPRNPVARIPVLEFQSAEPIQVFLAPQGNALAYFLPGDGLYVLDTANGLSGRVLRVTTLGQRGIISDPAWRVDGRVMAMAFESGYSLDIYGFDVANSTWLPLVVDDSYNFWPAFSPDGRYLAFVSDRETCPTWNPNDANACTPETDATPQGGHVYVIEVATGETFRLSEEPTFEPPYWINNNQVAFSSSNQNSDDLLAPPARSLWVGSVAGQSAQRVDLQSGGTNQYNIAETWSDDGSRVIFQQAAGDVTDTVVMNTQGQQLARLDNLDFARFSMSADWSTDGTRLALGGANGQCPYGVRVLNGDLNAVGTGNIPPSMCNPVFSPNGNLIAFTGVNPARGDGRVDVYTTSANGVDRVNLTADLRGSMRLIGWVGP